MTTHTRRYPSGSPFTLLFALLLAAIPAGLPDRVFSWSPPQSGVQAPPTPLLDLTGSPRAGTDRLHAQLWTELSPEYRALCRQIFNNALHQIQAVVDHSPRVDGVPVGGSGKPLAIVADLDETILDNSGYQAQLVLQGVDFTPTTWEAWVVQGSGVRLIPGAGEFLRRVDRLGVAIVYLSNRSVQRRAFTVRTLRRLGIDFSHLESDFQQRLFLRDGDSDKEPRRRKVQSRFEVVAYLGDNIEDFPSRPDSPTTRLQQVENLDALWGSRWFVLPNPLYGSWTRPLDGRQPTRVLREHLSGEGIQ